MSDPQEPKTYRVVMDVATKRPACVILQAALGGDSSAASLFDSRHWLVQPTPTMQLFAASREDLTKASKALDKLYPGGRK